MAIVNDADKKSATPTHTEAIFCITDNPKHDAAAVGTFMNITNTYLKEKYQILSEVLFTDCCAAQYRGKNSFADFFFMKQDTDLDVSRHYFESSHRKSSADGLAAIVEHSATTAVTMSQTRLQTTQPTSGGAVSADKNCCANCVEPSRPQQWGPDLPFFGHAGHADPLDGWRCCSQKRVMSRPIQVRQH